MKLFGLLFIFVTGVSLGDTSKILQIEHIDPGDTPEEFPHIYFDDGRVGVLRSSNVAIDAWKKNQFVKVRLDSNHTIISIEPSEKVDVEELEEHDNSSGKEYSPTILPDLKSASTIFRRMNRKWTKSSECFNRAHIWNYEEYKRSGLLSKKVFIFFTKRYIRKYKFYWWFHAIPTVLVKVNGKVSERALDPRYTKRPLQMKTWSNVFVRSKATCPVINKYSDYYKNEEKADCYLHYSSMYMWKPRDLEVLEMRGTQKESFIDYEIKKAYRQGFNIRTQF